MSSEMADTTSPDDKCMLTETSDRGSNPKKRKMTATLLRLMSSEMADTTSPDDKIS